MRHLAFGDGLVDPVAKQRLRISVKIGTVISVFVLTEQEARARRKRVLLAGSFSSSNASARSHSSTWPVRKAQHDDWMDLVNAEA
jgi:hypothetical protein